MLFMSTVRKSAQYYCIVFISTNARRINYKYIIATISSMCVITIFRLYNIVYCITHMKLLVAIMYL